MQVIHNINEIICTSLFMNELFGIFGNRFVSLSQVPVWCSENVSPGENASPYLSFRFENRVLLRSITLYGNNTHGGMVTAFNITYTNTHGYDENTASAMWVQYNHYAGDYKVRI